MFRFFWDTRYSLLHKDNVLLDKRTACFYTLTPYSLLYSTLDPHWPILLRFRWHRTLKAHTTLLMKMSTLGLSLSSSSSPCAPFPLSLTPLPLASPVLSSCFGCGSSSTISREGLSWQRTTAEFGSEGFGPCPMCDESTWGLEQSMPLFGWLVARVAEFILESLMKYLS